MKKSLSLMFLAFSWFIFSCNHAQNEKQEMAAHNFKSYLKKNFHQSIRTGKHLYFLVPATQCVNCNFYSVGRVPDNLLPQLTIITSYSASHFNGFKDLLLDTVGGLGTLPLVNYTNKLVLTNQDKVLAIYNVDTNFYTVMDSISKSGF